MDAGEWDMPSGGASVAGSDFQGNSIFVLNNLTPGNLLEQV